MSRSDTENGCFLPVNAAQEGKARLLRPSAMTAGEAPMKATQLRGGG
jgi:hypothetical protein